jgi:hypothetical protein
MARIPLYGFDVSERTELRTTVVRANPDVALDGKAA